MRQFTVQVLSDSEFDSLPYSKARESFGCADPDKGLAFVRKTGIKEMDIGTLTHEVNHLMEKHSGESPDEDGIYYKSGSNFFSQIFGGGGLGGILGDVAGVALAPFTGGASLGFLPLLSAGGGAIQAGIEGKNVLGGALQGFGVGGLGAGLAGAAVGGLEGAAGGLSGIGSGLVSGAEGGANEFISGIPGFGSGGALNAATGLGGASFAPTTAASLAPSSLAIPGQAAANAAAATGVSGALPGASTNLLGGAVNAVNAATAPGVAGTAAPISSLITPAGGGIGGTTGVAGLNNTPAMSLAQGGVGNVLGQPIQAGLPSTTANPVTGLASTVAQQTPTPGAGITTALGSTQTAPAAPAAASTGLGAKNLLGLGAGLLGASALTPSPTFQMPPQIAALESQLQSGQASTPLGASAQNALQGIINSPLSQLDSPLTANDPYFASTFNQMDIANQQAVQQLQASYQANGQLGSQEYQTQLANLLQQQSDAKNQIVAQENQQRYLTAQQQQYSAIQTALGADQNTMNDLIGLSGLSVEEAAAQYQVSSQDVQAIRNALSGIGASAVTQGLGINSKSPISVTL